MSHVQSSIALTILSVSSRVSDEAVLQLVQASFKNGSLSETERLMALEDAQQKGVTISEYLRGRLLMQAGIALGTRDAHSETSPL